MGRRATRDRTPRQRFLAKLRAAHGVTNRDLAARLGVSHSTITRWSNGHNVVGVDELRLETAAGRDDNANQG